jgi:hypothetical protein
MARGRLVPFVQRMNGLNVLLQQRVHCFFRHRSTSHCRLWDFDCRPADDLARQSRVRNNHRTMIRANWNAHTVETRDTPSLASERASCCQTDPYTTVGRCARVLPATAAILTQHLTLYTRHSGRTRTWGSSRSHTTRQAWDTRQDQRSTVRALKNAAYLTKPRRFFRTSTSFPAQRPVSQTGNTRVFHTQGDWLPTAFRYYHFRFAANTQKHRMTFL